MPIETKEKDAIVADFYKYQYRGIEARHLQLFQGAREVMGMVYSTYTPSDEMRLGLSNLASWVAIMSFEDGLRVLSDAHRRMKCMYTLEGLGLQHMLKIYYDHELIELAAKDATFKAAYQICMQRSPSCVSLALDYATVTFTADGSRIKNMGIESSHDVSGITAWLVARTSPAAYQGIEEEIEKILAARLSAFCKPIPKVIGPATH